MGPVPSMPASISLYAFGSNGSGQLGLQHQDDCSIPQEVKLPLSPSTSDVTIRKIAGGGSHTLLLFDDGVCFAAGSNAKGQLGGIESIHQSDDERSPRLGFKPICSLFAIKACSALWEASVMVTQDDEIFVMGSGPKGELGLGPSTTQVLSPQKISDFPPNGAAIMSIASGIAHTVVVLANGELWGWGNGRKGQLGEPAEIVHLPRRIASPMPVFAKEVVCGREFSCLAGTALGTLPRILGADKWNIVSDCPRALTARGSRYQMDVYTSVSAGWHGVVFLFPGGELDKWGRNDRGQLPIPLTSTPLEQVVAGSEHCVGVTTEQTLVCCGWGEHGNCGPDTDEEGNVKGWARVRLQVPPDQVIVGIGAGCATSFVWSKPIAGDKG